MTLDGKLLKGLFNHERLKPPMLRTSEGNVGKLSQLKQVMNYRIVNLILIVNLLEFVYLI